MATKRIASSSVDWSAFAKRVPEAQIPQFHAFKSKSDSYMMKVASLPETLPALNWSQYQAKVSVPGMVAEFKKQYESLTIPYPQDVYSSKITEQEKTAMAQVVEFAISGEKKIADMKAEIVRIESLLPMEEMNLEELFDAYPEIALDPFDRPTMWPHTVEDQPEYIEQMAKEGKFDEEH